MQMRTVQTVPVQHSDKERILSLLLCVLFAKPQELLFYPYKKSKVKTLQTKSISQASKPFKLFHLILCRKMLGFKNVTHHTAAGNTKMQETSVNVLTSD